MGHASEALLSATYEAFLRGEIEAMLANCASDIVVHVPGCSRMAGMYRGHEGFVTMVNKVIDLSHGTFREDVHDIIANDEHAAVLARHSLERNGQRFEYETIHVWHIKDGKLTEFWEHPGDPVTFDEAWA